ncbi:hypothetical protein [Lactococcus fujiensis]|nr:hypothetical protein [Lactococcus fujiensis]
MRPLALRYNLTPKVTTFYQQIARDGLFAPGVGKIL